MSEGFPSSKVYPAVLYDPKMEPQIPYHESAKELLKLGLGQKKCLYPSATGQCQQKVIRAHTISKSAALAKMARAGKVYQLDTNPFSIKASEGMPTLQLVNIASATIFTGFCGPHDNALFEPIDKGNLAPTLEEAFLLHYRSVCRELYESRTAPEANLLLKQVSRRNSSAARHWFQERAKAIAASLRIIEANKRICDDALLKRDFGVLRGAYIRFRKVPSVACSGYTQPVFDFQGNQVQNFSHYAEPNFNLSFTLLPNGDGGLAVFGWSQDADIPCRKFVQSLMEVKQGRETDALIQYAFDSFSNFATEPGWWDGLAQQKKDTLSMTMLNWTECPFLGNDSGTLIPSVDRFDDWEVEGLNWLC